VAGVWGNREVAPADRRALLEDWVRAVVETRGLTAIRDLDEAKRVLLEDSLRGVEIVRLLKGPIVDVGSGGGAPGIPLAAALPDREVTLLEAEERKADFLRRWQSRLANLRVVHGRAEQQETDAFGAAVAKALAPPPVAAEWCLPLVRAGGAVVLWVGPSAEIDRVARVSEQLAGGTPENHQGLLVIPKLERTPEGFPRRPGMARKRPLA
jgi:16S rRNA (guanine527-N7)-methyltransferase